MNKKGFTLTELLVVVVILGIIAGLSIPLIRNLSAGFEKRKYQSYADSVLASAKLFNDSYSEDLFGHNEYGCAYITYDKLVERKLLKDIEIDGMSCNSDKTYIRVIKQKDKYAYTTYLSCGKKTEGKIENVSLSIPENIPDMDNNACTGVNNSNLSVTADLTQANGKADKVKKKTKIIISSGTGIDSIMSISAKWSQNSNDYSNSGFTKVDFKVKENQEESLANGEIITTSSKELLTPNGNGAFYLIVRVDQLNDLHGHAWTNPDGTDSRYLSFGPFIIDNTPPTMNVSVFKCDANGSKTGNATGTDSISSGNKVFNLSSIQGNVSGWATSSNYANGVCISFDLGDNLSIKSSKWEWNEAGKKANASGYKTFDSSRSWTESYSSGVTSKTITKSLTGDGHRYARFTVKDYAGHTTSIDIDLKLDKTGPTKPTITNPSNGEWKNSNITITIASSDALNSMGEYYSTLNSNNTGWTKITEGTGKTSFTKTYSDNQNSKIYIKACDSLGNCSASNNTTIKIDKTKPNAPTISNPTSGNWTASNIKLGVSSSDTYSGIADYYYSYSSSASAIGTNDASQWVKLSGGTEKTSFTTSEFSTGANTTFNKTIYIRVYDKAGNYSNTSSTPLKIDKTKPATPTITNPTNGNWTNGNVTLTLKSSDTGSGLGDYQYSYSSSPSGVGTNAASQWVSEGKTATATYTANARSTEMNRKIYWRVCDKVGNCSASSNTTLRIDKTAPGIPTITNPTNGNWVNSNVTLTLQSKDTGGSGLSSYQYTYNSYPSGVGTNPASHWVLDGKQATETYTTNAIATQLNGTVYWRACDVAGNCSASRGTTIRIDKTPPAVPTITNPTNGNWVNSNVVLTLNSSDTGGSGLSSYQFTYNSYPSGVGTNPATHWVSDGKQATETYTTNAITAELNGTGYWRACDVAGNCSASRATTLKIDKHAPSCAGVTKTTTYSSRGVSGYASCTDSYSQCKQSSYEFSGLKSSTSITIEDNASNTSTCEVSVSSYEEWDYWWDSCWEPAEKQLFCYNIDACNRNCHKSAAYEANCSGHYIEGWYRFPDGHWTTGGSGEGTCWTGCDSGTGGVDICHPYCQWQTVSGGYYYDCKQWYSYYVYY